MRSLVTEDEEFDEDTAMMMMLLAMHEEEEQQRHRDAPLDDDEREPRVRLGYEALCAKYSCHAFKLHFRFDKEDIPRLAKALEMPVIKCPVTGARAEPCDALLYVLKRHAYPIRWVDMGAFFGRAVSTLAGIGSESLRFLYNHWVVRIALHMDVERLDPGKLGPRLRPRGFQLAGSRARSSRICRGSPFRAKDTPNRKFVFLKSHSTPRAIIKPSLHFPPPTAASVS